jgi:hypothetical protein
MGHQDSMRVATQWNGGQAVSIAKHTAGTLKAIRGDVGAADNQASRPFFEISAAFHYSKISLNHREMPFRLGKVVETNTGCRPLGGDSE